MAFKNYGKAFDFVLTAAVLEELKDQGIEETYIRLLERMYKGSTGRIILHKESDKFSARNGVRQRNTISPKQFTACLGGGYVLRALDRENIGLRINGEYLSHLRFEDDAVLLSKIAEGIQTVLGEIFRQHGRLG